MQLELTEGEVRDFRRLAGIILPASSEYDTPGAADPAIFDDILRSLGQDLDAVRRALASLAARAGGAFAGLDDAAAEVMGLGFMETGGADAMTLGRSVLQCYYRDDRVMRALGLTPRPPYPLGHTLEDGDFGLLDAVRGRPRMWRDVDRAEAQRR